jgi:hypothetical protein
MTADHPRAQTGRIIIVTSYNTFTRRAAYRPGAGLPDEDEDLDDDQDDGSGEEDNTHPALRPDATARPREVRLAIRNDWWEVVVCDECHTLKNRETIANHVVDALNKESLLLVSATPLANHVRDIHGYAKLIWNRHWPFTVDKGSTHFADYYHPESWTKLVEQGEFRDLAWGRLLESGFDNPAPTPTTPVEERRAEEYCRFIEECRGPLYILNPQMLRSYADSVGHGTEMSTDAAQRILEMTAVRRGMLTMMKMPDGSETCLGASIKGLKVSVVTLKLSAEARGRVQDYICRNIDNLYSVREGDRELVGGQSSESPRVQMNGAVNRNLALVGTDPNNIKLVEPRTRWIREILDKSAPAAEKASGGFHSTDLMKIDDAQDEEGGVGGGIPSDGGPEPGALETDSAMVARGEAASGKRKRKVAAGTAEMNAIAGSRADPAGSIRWHYMQTRDSARYPFPTTRAQQARVMVYDSPKYAYVALKALELQAEGKRLLVIVNHAASSQ